MSENPEVVPDATGIADGEVPVEKVEHLGDALKRLAQGAGKKHDTCLIEEARGLSWDGVVVTKIDYPFGFAAKLEASMLRSVLQHIRTPSVSTAAKSVLLSEGGKKFRISKLVRDAMVPEWEPGPDGHAAMGEWLTRLLPILPSRSGPGGSFAGVLVCEKGYVGTNGAMLVWTEAAGPETSGIIAKELVSRLPSGEITLSLTENHAWATEGDTMWTAPLVAGEFPDWQSAFFECDRSATVDKKELLEALRAITCVHPHAYFVRIADEERLVLRSVNTADARTMASQGSRAQASIKLVDHTSEDFTLTLDAKMLLSALDRAKGQHIWLGTDARQDRAYVKATEQRPPTHVLMMGLAGFGIRPEDLE